MSWLHCMWGVGASVGPFLISYAMAKQTGWSAGYRIVAVLQAVLTLILFFSLPLWKRYSNHPEKKEQKKRPLSLKEIFRIRGVREIMITFFCYCALESTTSLWASSYLVLKKEVSADTAAGLASCFFLGITAGRFLSGFLTLHYNDSQMIHLGQGFLLAGITVLLLPLKADFALAGFVLIGLGCAPIYPCIIHATPSHFGADNSQAIIGVQMASAYIGTCFMPPVFGFLANHITIALLPFYLLFITLLMIFMYERLLHKTAERSNL